MQYFLQHIALLGPPKEDTVEVSNWEHYNHFERGSVYYVSGVGSAVGVYGPILNKWAEMGYEKSCLEYPKEEEQVTRSLPQGSRSPGNQNIEVYHTQTFQNGYISYTVGGQTEVKCYSSTPSSPIPPPYEGPGGQDQGGGRYYYDYEVEVKNVYGFLVCITYGLYLKEDGSIGREAVRYDFCAGAGTPSIPWG